MKTHIRNVIRNWDAEAVASPFVVALRAAILNKVRCLRADGCDAMTAANLRQLVQSPSHGLDGAPRGTNAAYFYGELFNREAARIASSFLIAEGAR